MKYLLIPPILLFQIASYAQLSITLKYKTPKCGGARKTDTSSYFLFTNKKWIILSPNQKIDTLYTDINGKIKIPNKKGNYLLFDPIKFYQQYPPTYPHQFYNKSCLQEYWKTPDFEIIITSKRKYTIQPPYLTTYCPDKHPCLRTDTIIPRIPHKE